jgi:exonuclease SbcC
MLKSIWLQNFQSHKDTKLELSEGINVIMGKGRSGKTAVERAIEWVAFNRPLGFRFHSNFTKDGFTAVTIELSEGISIRKEKTSKATKYTIDYGDGEVSTPSAAGAGVPEEVKEVLGIDTINLQSQFASHFIFSPPEMARVISAATGNDEADDILRILNKKLTETTTLETSKKLEAATVTEELKEMPDAAGALLYISQAKDSIRAHHSNKQKLEKIESLIESYINTEDSKDQIGKALADAESKLAKLEDCSATLRSLFSTAIKIDQYTTTAAKADFIAKRIAKLTSALERIETSITGQSGLFRKRDDIYNKAEEVNRLTQTARSLRTAIKAKGKELQATKDLIGFCPLCERPYGSDHEEVCGDI